MSIDTPLSKATGSSIGGPGSNYVNTMNALAGQAKTRADDFQKNGLDYMKQWQNVVTTRVNSEMKRTDQLRRDADHYKAKVEALEKQVSALREKGKEVPSSTAEKVQRNHEKLEEANKVYNFAATELYLLMDETVARAWRDLYPLFLKLLQLELEIGDQDGKVIDGDLKPLEAALKKFGKSKWQIPSSGRLEKLEKSSPKNLSTRSDRDKSNVNLSFGTDAPEQAPAAKPLPPPPATTPSKRGVSRGRKSDPSPARKSVAERAKEMMSRNKNTNETPKPATRGRSKPPATRGRSKPPAERASVKRSPATNAGAGVAAGRAIKTAASQSSTPRHESSGDENYDPKKWKLVQNQFSGAFTYATKGKQEEVRGPVNEGLAKIKQHPEKYLIMFHQTNMVDWPTDQQRYILIHREGSTGYVPKGLGKGHMTLYMQEYEQLPRFKDDILPTQYRDKYTDDMKHNGRKLHSKTNKPIMPGRGMGCVDSPLLKIIGDVDPSDIHQGAVGDCWLLSGISSLAEFDGAIKRLFRKTKKLEQRPLDGPNTYTITLYDLPSWREVDIVIDERLASASDGTGLLASKPSEDGELWVCYLEKALAIHCGGWDKITGGQCTHAWALLTGCKEQYTIRKNPKTGKYQCFGKYNPYENRWAKHANSPHEGEQSLWNMAWPEVGGGGDKDLELSADDLFQRMCAWDQVNFIVGASCSDSGADKGLVDDHAYSVIEAHSNVAGTNIDLLKVRNPWGKGEIEDGEFDDDGPGWDKYPQIKKALNPVVADDGIFWVTKKEFFVFFSTVFLSASNMTEFLED